VSKFKVGDKVRSKLGTLEGVVESVPTVERPWYDVKWPKAIGAYFTSWAYEDALQLAEESVVKTSTSTERTEFVAVPRTLLRDLVCVLEGSQKEAVLALLGEGHFGPSKPPCSGCGGYKWVGCGDEPGCSECRVV
jgi:hypothetical protein